MNYYEVLGLDRNAEPEVIGAAYRAMMRRHHPDTFSGPKDEAERRAKQLNEAYEVLKDPDRRRAYDATLGPSPPSLEPEYVTLPTRGESNFQRRRVAIVLGVAAIGAVGLAASFVQQRAMSQAQPSPVSSESLAAKSVAPQAANATPTLSAVPSETPTCKGVSCRTMTPVGWGGIEAGVTTDRAQQSSGMTIEDNGHYTGVGDGSCLEYAVVDGPPNLQMLVESGVVTTVEVSLNPKNPKFRTDRGVGLGDPESSVLAAYGQLKQLPDIYSEPPDRKLLFYDSSGTRGIKFSINGGKVTGISVGTRSIEYVEGCL